MLCVGGFVSVGGLVLAKLTHKLDVQTHIQRLGTARPHKRVALFYSVLHHLLVARSYVRLKRRRFSFFFLVFFLVARCYVRLKRRFSSLVRS